MHFALVGMRATTVLQGVRTLSKSPVLTDGSIWMAKRVQSGPEKFAPVAGPRGPGTVARVPRGTRATCCGRLLNAESSRFALSLSASPLADGSTMTNEEHGNACSHRFDLSVERFASAVAQRPISTVSSASQIAPLTFRPQEEPAREMLSRGVLTPQPPIEAVAGTGSAVV